MGTKEASATSTNADAMTRTRLGTGSTQTSRPRLVRLTRSAGLEIVADHDPIPLLNQVQQRTPGRFEITYLERGPVDFRVQFIAVS